MRCMTLWLTGIAVAGLLVLAATPSARAGELAVETPALPVAYSATAEDAGAKRIKHLAQVGSGTVEVVLDGGSAFLIARAGDLAVVYADGAPLCTVPAGEGVKIAGFFGRGSGVTLSKDGAGRPRVTLAAGLAFEISTGTKAPPLTLHHGSGRAEVVQPGKTGKVAVAVKHFAVGQKVELKPGQVGEIKVADGDLCVVGATDGMVVASSAGDGVLHGAGTDKLLIGADGLLKVFNGTLRITADGVLLAGTVAFECTQGQVLDFHAGRTVPLPVGQTLGTRTPAESSGH
ncbi:MAG: hypothetical protein ACREJ2_14685 [Planctomycetota bacterium]